MRVSRLPIATIARLMLGLMLVCNLTLCISWQRSGSPQETMASEPMAATMAASACHAMASPDADPLASLVQEPCQMHDSIPAPAASGLPLLTALLVLFALPLLLFSLRDTRLSWSDHWLRDPFLRERGTHPPSWPRRHLMLSVLRH